MSNTKLDIKLVRTSKEFQGRDQKAEPSKYSKSSDAEISYGMIQGMISDLKASKKKELPAIEVWREGYFVLDGHHRLEAYKRAGRRKVPIIYKDFGSKAEAVSYALTRNLKNSKPLSQAQKSEQCWKYICLHFKEYGSKPKQSAIVDIFSMSKGQISKMVNSYETAVENLDNGLYQSWQEVCSFLVYD